MGAAHSRARPGAGPAARFTSHSGGGGGGGGRGGGGGASSLLKPSGRDKVAADNYGYFILCIKGGDRIKVVNASNLVLKQVRKNIIFFCFKGNVEEASFN